MLKEKTVSLKSHPTSQHIHTHVYFVHIYEYVYAEIWSIWILWALQVSYPDPRAHNKVSHMCKMFTLMPNTRLSEDCYYYCS